MNTNMMTDNTKTFLDTYKKELLKSVTSNPEDYSWTVDSLDEVFNRMSKAIVSGSFNKDSKAFKATCKTLRIKHTYRDIEIFLGVNGS